MGERERRSYSTMILLVTALFLCSFPVLQVVSAPVSELDKEVYENDTTGYPDEPDPPNGACLYDGLTMADPADSRAYFVCCAHYWLIKYCSQDEYFDKYVSSTTSFVVEICSFQGLTCLPLPPITHPAIPHLLSDSPPTGVIPIDDNSTNTGAPEATASPVCVSGDMKENPIDPSTFDVCVNGTRYETQHCPDGAVFNARIKLCEMPRQCVDGQTRPNHPSAVYYECFSNEWVEIRCLQGQLHYPGREGCEYPSPQTTTWKPPTRRPTRTTRRPTTRRPFVDGPCQESAGQDGFRPNPLDCRTYFQCVHSELLVPLSVRYQNFRRMDAKRLWTRNSMGADDSGM